MHEKVPIIFFLAKKHLAQVTDKFETFILI